MPKEKRLLNIKKYLDNETQEEAIKEYILKHPEIVEKAVKDYVVLDAHRVCEHLKYSSNSKVSKLYDDFRRESETVIHDYFSKMLKEHKTIELILTPEEIKELVQKELLPVIELSRQGNRNIIRESIRQYLPTLIQKTIETSSPIKEFMEAIEKELKQYISETTIQREVDRLLGRRSV